jgi:hypothetical protein
LKDWWKDVLKFLHCLWMCRIHDKKDNRYTLKINMWKDICEIKNISSLNYVIKLHNFDHLTLCYVQDYMFSSKSIPAQHSHGVH